MTKKCPKLFGWIVFALLFLAFTYRLSSGITSLRAPATVVLQRPPDDTSTEWLKYKDIYQDRYCTRRNLSNNRYGYASVIQQTRWISNITVKAVESHGPLIYYDDRFLWHTLSSDGCQYSCRFSTNFSDYPKAVLAVFTQDPPDGASLNLVNQTWALETGESPFHMPSISSAFKDHFKIFLTTKTDSHVPWIYGVFAANEEPEKIIPLDQQIRMLNKNNSQWLPKCHAGRRKKAVALISNLNARNNRLEYIKELAKHMEVDIYGNGHLPCSRNGDACLRELALKYKFYLAFENSNCEDYITEKFFENALKHDMVPVVMGAPRESYCALAPPNSFIHVDDFSSPAELADYLNWLDRNDTAYASYFAWKAYGNLMENTKLECRLCGFLHEDFKRLDSAPIKDFSYFTDTSKLCRTYAKT
ncbi:Alpha-(1,3)-fucosyltransferase 7 [Sparganum proliferum]